MRKIIFLSIILASFNSFAQNERDSILLLNGKVYHGKILGLSKHEGDSVLQYQTVSNNGVSTDDMFGTYRVFSYTQNGTETILYRQNNFLGNYLTVDETRDVTMGSYDARKTFKPIVPFWSTLAVSLGVSLMDTYLTQKAIDAPEYLGSETAPGFFKQGPSLLPILVPVLVSVSWSLPSFKLKEKKMIHKQYFNNENYYRGYHRIAKQKRMLGALVGGFSGLAAGMISYYTVQSFQ
jgi:hypothetical protein